MTDRAPARLPAEIRQRRRFATKAEEAVVGLLRTADGVQRASEGCLGAQGISGQQYNVLRILRGAGSEGLPTLEIAERLIERTPGITRLVDTLERKKLVTRERGTKDRRVVRCRITRAGLTLLGALDAPVVRAAGQAMRGLRPAELLRLIALMDRVRQTLD